jgi:hypothetical protein
MSHQPPQASHFQERSASLNGGPPVTLPMIVRRATGGVMFTIAVIRIVVALGIAVGIRALATRPYSQSGAIDPQRTSPQKSRFSAGHDSVENTGYLSLHVNERIFFGA